MKWIDDAVCEQRALPLSYCMDQDPCMNGRMYKQLFSPRSGFHSCMVLKQAHYLNVSDSHECRNGISVAAVSYKQCCVRPMH